MFYISSVVLLFVFIRCRGNVLTEPLPNSGHISHNIYALKILVSWRCLHYKRQEMVRLYLRDTELYPTPITFHVEPYSVFSTGCVDLLFVGDAVNNACYMVFSDGSISEYWVGRIGLVKFEVLPQYLLRATEVKPWKASVRITGPGTAIWISDLPNVKQEW